jgi:hypothetical protein
MSGSMKSDDQSVERVQVLVDRAERLRMQSAAVPLKDLKALLRACEAAKEQLNSSADQSASAGNLIRAQV